MLTHADISETRVKTARVLAWDTVELTRQNGERSMWLDGTVYKDLEINMDVKLYENQKTIIKFTCMLFKHQVNICACIICQNKDWKS